MESDLWTARFPATSVCAAEKQLSRRARGAAEQGARSPDRSVSLRFEIAWSGERPHVLSDGGVYPGLGFSSRKDELRPDDATDWNRRGAWRPYLPRQGRLCPTAAGLARLSKPVQVSGLAGPSRSRRKVLVGAITEIRTMTSSSGPVLILGARSDIARATAHLYASQGRPVILAARNSASLQADVNDLTIRHSVAVRAVEFDVLDTVSHAAFLNECGETPQTVICFVGLLGDQSAAQHDGKAAELVMRTNYLGPVLV